MEVDVDAGGESRLVVVRPSPSCEDPGAKTSEMNAAATRVESCYCRLERKEQASTTSLTAGEDESATGNFAGYSTSTSTRRESPPATAQTQHNISQGDRPQRNTAMTISNIIESSPQRTASSASSTTTGDIIEPMAVDDNGRRTSEDSDDVPMNLATSREEAINLSAKHNLFSLSPVVNSSSVGMSAKMRLKKQRLEAVARVAADMQRSQLQQQQQQTNQASSATSHQTSFQFYENHPTSALHRLAEAAERKQEEEMLEMSEPVSSAPSRANMRLIPAHILPLSEHEATTLTLTPTASPKIGPRLHPTSSPDSAIHSSVSGYYSPSQSPVQSRQVSGLSSPFSVRGTPSLSRTNSDASQRGGGSPATITLPSSPLPQSVIAAAASNPPNTRPYTLLQGVILSRHEEATRKPSPPDPEEGDAQAAASAAQPGISRQQLINSSPCPVCGDKISGFHYGIFSCESCKGFFKRTVQNKKNYQCLRGASCPISIATRKKCPACRFNKCLTTGMKLEAIREDRTRGGRSTYQCSYTLPANITASGVPSLPSSGLSKMEEDEPSNSDATFASMPPRADDDDGRADEPDESFKTRNSAAAQNVPLLIQEIMDVEHLWFSIKPNEHSTREIEPGENMVQTLTNMADKRLFKLVKWCKSLPLFKNILIDDQISLLINAWCELLVFSCCYRSVDTPGVIRVSNEKSLTYEAARAVGIEKWIEKMLNFTEQLRRLKVDYYEYVSMKVIVLLTSDASGLKEPENVRDSQEKVVQALQQYTATQYPEITSKFAELLLRMPELHRVCQGCKEMLCPRQSTDGEAPGFNLLMELLRGDH